MLSGALVAVGLGLETAALLDIFLVRIALRPVGGLLMVAGCRALMAVFLLEWLRKRTIHTHRLSAVLSPLAAIALGAMAVIQLAFTTLAVGPRSIRGLFTGAVMAILIGLVLIIFLLDSFISPGGDKKANRQRPAVRS